MAGSSWVLMASRLVHSSVAPCGPSTFSAAMYKSTVPNKACAIPTPHRMKYFQAASRLAAVRYTLTSNTVVSVAASIATHRMPRLLVVSASSMVKLNNWYMP